MAAGKPLAHSRISLRVAATDLSQVTTSAIAVEIASVIDVTALVIPPIIVSVAAVHHVSIEEPKEAILSAMVVVALSHQELILEETTR